MNILALDTSGPTAGVAVVKDGALLHEVFLNNGLTHSQTIMPAVEQAVSAAGLMPSQLDLIACVVGPGSFTGVRIGVCAARGIAHAAGVPCVAVDALRALAHAAYGFDGVVCPMLDARRDQVYAAAFAPGDVPRRLLPDAALSLADFLRALPGEGKLLFCGEAALLHSAELHTAFGDRASVAPSFLLHVRPAVAADLAARSPQSEYVPREKLLPLYLRAPSAERERAAREAAKA